MTTSDGRSFLAMKYEESPRRVGVWRGGSMKEDTRDMIMIGRRWH